MYFVYSFTDQNGWHELGVFDTLKQANEYAREVDNDSYNDDICLNVDISFNNEGMIVAGSNDILRRLFNLGGQPS